MKTMVISMMMILVLIFNTPISTAISLSEISLAITTSEKVWNVFNRIFFPDNGTPSTDLKPEVAKPTKLLLIFYDERKGRKRNRLIHFDQKATNKLIQGPTPLEMVHKAVQKLVKNKKIDVEDDCDLVYYDYIEEKVQPVDLADEADLIYLMAQAGDKNRGSVRLIEILCGPPPKPKREPEVNMALYKANERAFDHVIVKQSQHKNTLTTQARDDLNDAGIGGFSIKARGYVGLDLDEDVFESYIGNLAKAWEWKDQITTQLDMVTHAGKQFSGTFDIWFEPSEWKIKGNYQRFASFRTVEEKYTIYVATSNFEYAIPSDQREGDFLDRIGVKGGGAVSGKYFEKVGHLMEGEALRRFNKDISKPSLEYYQKYGNKPDL